MKRQLKTEIIAVGTEILLGQITNTNATWMAEQLATYGINTYYQTVVGDNLERLTDVFETARKRANVIIVTGGLGPTEDDLSREAFQAISNIPMLEDEYALEKIARFYEKQQTVMTPNNRRQARVFKDSLVLTNKVGMAPGNIVQYEGVNWIFLPGVPREMKQLFTDEVIPYLRSINGEMTIKSTVLKFIGIGESVLEHKLADLIKNQQNPTIALLAQNDGVTIRLTAKGENTNVVNKMLEQMKDEILNIVGSFCYGSDERTIQETISQLLRDNNLKIAAAESLTGGLFADRFVSLEGASNVFTGSIVCYDTKVKEQILHVKKSTIENDGVVSRQCATEMAKNVSYLLDANIGISFTGVAGPSKLENKEVGTTYIGLYDKRTGETIVEECYFQGNRKQIRLRSVLKGMEILFKLLK